MRPSDVGPIQNEKGADAVVRIAPTHQESAGGFPRLLAVRTKIDGISSSLDHRDPGDGLFPSLEPSRSNRRVLFARHIICERKLQYSGKPFPFGKFGSTRDRGSRLVDRPDADII